MDRIVKVNIHFKKNYFDYFKFIDLIPLLDALGYS